MASFASVFQQQKNEAFPLRQGKLFRIHYSKLVQSKFQYRGITREAVEKLADLLEAERTVMKYCQAIRGFRPAGYWSRNGEGFRFP